MHIATLGDGATLNMEITLNHGRGYVSADRNKQPSRDVIGAIPVDSIYTPVLQGQLHGGEHPRGQHHRL